MNLKLDVILCVYISDKPEIWYNHELVLFEGVALFFWDWRPWQLYKTEQDNIIVLESYTGLYREIWWALNKGWESIWPKSLNW